MADKPNVIRVTVSLTPEQVEGLTAFEGKSIAERIRNAMEAAGIPNNLKSWGGDRSTPQNAQNGQGE